MKRHGDDMNNKNKRFSYSSDNRSPLQPQPSSSSSSSSSSYYSYNTPMWVDPRADIKNHANMSMFQPQNLMMQWNSASATHLYNPMQPPPPLPIDRPPLDTPPPPPPHPRRNQMNNNNMRRGPRNRDQGYMNGPFRRNNHQNHHNHHNHANHNHANHPNRQNHQHNQHNQSNNEHEGSPSSVSGASSTQTPSADGKIDDNAQKPALKVNKKARRKPMSERYTCKKEWNAEDAEKALTLENAYNHLIKKVPMLILRFPDPELNKALIHSYSPAIETVHFQQPSRARYCFVQLKADADIEQVKKEISQIDFGTGKVSVENKITRHEVSEVTPEQLDPYTLYVGNLPTKLNVTIFKEKFPSAKRIDIGYAQRTKFTRYAFLHYDNVDDSMEAFKTTYNLTIDARSLVVRFRRNKGSVGLSEKGKKLRKDEEGAEGEKKDVKKVSGTPLFDDEFVDDKSAVKERADQLRKEGYGLNFPSDDHLLGTSVKQEPLSDDDGHSEVGYVFDRENDTFDEEDTFINSEDEGSDNEYDDEHSNEYGNSDTNKYGHQHWNRADKPEVKEERIDNEYGEPSDLEPNTANNKPVPIAPKMEPRMEDDDDLDDDDLFNGLNPDDGLDIGFDDL